MQTLKLQVLWLNDSLGLCVNYKISRGILPLTPYYFWLINDAWEQIKVELESKKWISDDERIKILNLIVEVMNTWQRSHRTQDTKNNNEEKLPNIENKFIIGFS